MSNKTVNWTKGFDYESLISQIARTIKIKPDGSIAFEGFAHFEHSSLLHSMLSFPSDVPELDARGLVNEALNFAATKRPISAKEIRNRVNAKLREYYKRDLVPYILISSLSTNPKLQFPVAKLEGATISFNPSTSQVFLDHRSSIVEEAENLIGSEIPANFHFVRVHQRARTIQHAANSALYALDLLRGMWNLQLNRNRFIRFSSGKKQPVNQILLGPLHTLHNTDGRLATDTFWYEPLFSDPTFRFSRSRKLDNLLIFSRKIRQRLRNHPYSGVIRDSIVSYARALDKTDWHSSFLSLWATLENLAMDKKEHYDHLINRVSFVFEDHRYQKQILNHLRVIRNRLVHEGAESQSLEGIMYQAKNNVEAMIMFHITHGRHLGSFEKALEFLKLPPEIGKLNDQIAVRTRALSYRTP